jgi:hypothetical protein
MDCEIANVALKKLRGERLAESAVLACLDACAAPDLERHAVIDHRTVDSGSRVPDSRWRREVSAFGTTGSAL